MHPVSIIRNINSIDWADRYESADAAKLLVETFPHCDGLSGSPTQEDVVVFLGDAVAAGAGRHFKDVFYKDPGDLDKWGDPRLHPVRRHLDEYEHPDMLDKDWNTLLDRMTWAYIRSGNVDIYHGKKQKRPPQECRDYMANEAKNWQSASVFPITDGTQVITRAEELDWQDPYLSWVAVQSAMDAIGRCDGEEGRPDAFDVLRFFGDGVARGYSEALANKLFKAGRPFKEEAPYKEYFMRNKPEYFEPIQWSKWCNACLQAYRKGGAYDDFTYSNDEMEKYREGDATNWADGLEVPERA